MKKIAIFLICLTSILYGFSQGLYKLAHTFPVEGEGGWDYLACESESGRLFISHGSVVNVMDIKTGKLVGIIPDTKGVHGIALARDLDKGFISNGRDSSVTIFTLSTLATIAKVNVTGKNPDAILYDPFSAKVFAFNGRTNNATVIDAKTNKVVGTIPLDG